VFACATLIAASAVASDKTDPIAPIQQFTDSMNKGDTKSALAAFADEPSIIDDLAPHYWHGKGASEQWLAAVDADSKKTGMMDFVSTLKTPRRLLIDGDNAFAIVPMTYTYNLKGTTGHGSAIMTVALRKQAGAWRISAIAFTTR
jgi:hypothetical protein